MLFAAFGTIRASCDYSVFYDKLVIVLSVIRFGCAEKVSGSGNIYLILCYSGYLSI